MDNRKFSGMIVPGTNFYLWTIGVLVVIIAILDWRVSIPAFMLFLYLIFYNFKVNNQRKNEIIRYIENLTFNIDSAAKDTLLNFPLPLVVLEMSGVIVWYNSLFMDIFKGEELFENSIHSFVAGLDINRFVEGDREAFADVLINGRHYTLLGNVVRTDSQKSKQILMLYLVDVTPHAELLKTYMDERPVVGLVIIDNYDELMQNTEDEHRSQMLAEIEKKINAWAGFAGGILKKFERDKYLFVFEHRHLEVFQEKKFEILDSVKEINIGNKIPVTLSIGIGLNGETFAENLASASASIDIALGRGGDQVVIKDGENFSFYGGRTRELEKRTRVKARVIAHALRELIDQSAHVVIMGHESADVDCIGAALGLYRLACLRNKPTHIVLQSSNPAIHGILTKLEKEPEYEGIFLGHSEARDMVDKRTLLIVVDTHKPGFTEQPELLKLTDQVVVIDHHRKSADFIQDAVLTYQETYASSTCELVTEILQYVDDRVKLNPLEAEALYAGIVVDTKNFTFKTGVRTFDAASFLRKQGVNTVSVKQLFQNDLETYVIRAGVVRDAEIIGDNIALSACPPNIKNSQLIAAQAADELLGLSGIAAAFVFSVTGNEIWISGRSLGDINVQMILEKLGGGGHMTVAGAQLHGVTLEEAREQLKSAIIEYIENTSGQQK